MCVNAANVPAPIFYAHKCSQERRLPSPFLPLSPYLLLALSPLILVKFIVFAYSRNSLIAPFVVQFSRRLAYFLCCFIIFISRHCSYATFVNKGNSSSQLMCPPPSLPLPPSLSLSVLGFLTSHS